MPQISRRAFAAAVVAAVLMSGGSYAADAPREIHLDWATYNPVSMILKQKGLLEKEFAKDGISIVWVQSADSNKALEFLNAGSIDVGSTAGSAALVTTWDSKIAADLKGKRVAVCCSTPTARPR